MDRKSHKQVKKQNLFNKILQQNYMHLIVIYLTSKD